MFYVCVLYTEHVKWPHNVCPSVPPSASLTLVTTQGIFIKFGSGVCKLNVSANLAYQLNKFRAYIVIYVKLKLIP
jgi:hypothetical protein